jgi:DNA-binding GntR family transcriptional regulator
MAIPPPLFAPIAARTVTSQVCEALRHQILSGQLREGATLRQEKIAAELGVSRNPVREAIQQLAAEGLLTLVSHKGAVVSRLSPDELRETYEMRAKLEGWLLGLSIPVMTKEQLDASEQLLASLSSPFPDEEWSRRNWEFHVSLLEPARRTQTIEVCRKLYVNAYRHVPAPIRLADRRSMNKEHRQLLDYCRTGKVTKAVELLERHITESGYALIAKLEQMRSGA